MKEKKSRKEWVKTVAIIFLSILLVLTFFSNTIQNYSLPEVSAQYCYSGQVTNKIRGTGVVETADPYSVKLNGAREIESVLVREGDYVSKGDVLFNLVEGESEEEAEAKKALEEAKDAYEDALISKEVSTKVSNDIEENGTDSISSYQLKLETAKRRVEGWENKISELKKAQRNNGTSGSKEDKNSLKNARRQLEAAQEQVTKEEASLADAKANYESAKQAISDQKELIEKLKKEISDASDVSSNDYKPENLYDLEKDLKEAEDKLPSLEEAKKKAKKTLDKAQASYDKAVSQVAVWKAAIEDIEDSIENKGDSISRQLEDAEDALEKARKDYEELRDEITTKLGLEKLLGDIKKAEENVEKLKNKTANNQYVSPVDGLILSVNIVAGDVTESGAEIISIQKSGKGFTLSMTVTNKQAQMINIGDEAEVSNSWWYSDVHARVKQIAPDKADPTKNKQVTFDLEGTDLTAGQSLSLTVGNKSANYDIVVPSSAIREDNNGKFILKVVSKDTPLGTRYTAERVDVTVLAEDDANTAISGNMDSWEFVITTTSKPVESGQLIRLKDN